MTNNKFNNFVGFYNLDTKEGKTEVNRINEPTEDYNKWLESSKLKVLGKEGREYKFSSDATEVYSCIKKYIESFDEGYIEKIANRLSRTLATAGEKYGHIANIDKNHLVASIALKENKEYECFFVLFHNEYFLNSESYRKNTGLSYEKSTFKAVIINLDQNLKLVNMRLSDTNNTISKYWSEGFLESIEVINDTTNSKNAFSFVEKFLKETVGKISKVDYQELRNDTVAYLRVEKQFNYSGFKEKVFDNYIPISDKISKEDLTRDLDEHRKKLKERSKFDDTFTIDKKSIKGRIRHKIELHDNIELTLKEDVKNLRNVIQSIKHHNKKGVFIESENGYNEFSANGK